MYLKLCVMYIYLTLQKVSTVDIRKLRITTYIGHKCIIFLYFFNETVCVVLLVSYKYLHLAHIYDILNPFSYNRMGTRTICN